MNAINQCWPLLAPQEQFNHLFAATVRRRGRKVIDLSYANVQQGPDETVLRALELSIRDSRPLAFQYTPYGGRITTRRAIASVLAAEQGQPFTYRDVVLTPGAMAALNVVLRALFDRGHELIVLTPCWQDGPLYARNLGIPVVMVPLAEDKHLDLDAIRRAIGWGTRGVLLSHPACPAGVVYRPDEIEGLSTLLQDAEAALGTRIYLISDEVHRHLIWNSVPFLSPLASYPRTVSIYSFGKALALQGERIGYAAVSPRMAEHAEVREALERGVRLMGFCGPTELMQHTICRLLDYRPSLDGLRRQQQDVRASLTSCGYEICGADATFFVYVKSPLADDSQFVAALADYGVLVLPSSIFHEPGYFRISLTASESSVVAALPIFARVRDESLTRRDARVTAADPEFLLG